MIYAVVPRSLFAFVTAFGLTVLLGAALLPVLRSIYRDPSETAPEAITGSPPSMGGIVLFASILLTSLLFARDGYRLLLPALLLTGAFAALGFADDFIGVMHRKPSGILPWQRIAIEASVSLTFGVTLYYVLANGGSVWSDALPIGVFYIAFASLVCWGTVGAVRTADKPDGVVSSVFCVCALFFAILLAIAVLCAPMTAAIEQLMNRTSLAVFGAATAGASIAFTLFDAHPARMRMGSTGLYTLSGAIASLALLSETALLLPLTGVCFLITAAPKARDSMQTLTDRFLPNGFGASKGSSEPAARSAKSTAGARILPIYLVITVLCSAVALIIYWFLK